MFKIQDKKTGLYSSGGYYPSWTATGKTYQTRAQVKSALQTYARGEPARGCQFKTQKARDEEAKKRRKKIPSNWVVVELAVTICGQFPATDLLDKC